MTQNAWKLCALQQHACNTDCDTIILVRGVELFAVLYVANGRGEARPEQSQFISAIDCN